VSFPRPVDATGTRIRWGIPDALVAWVVGFVASMPALAGLEAGATIGPARTALAVVLQNCGIVAALWLISYLKGQGSLARDFGFPEPRSFVPSVVGTWLALGVAGSIAVNVVLIPIQRLGDIDQNAQEVARTVRHAHGAALVALFVAIVVVAPLVEELLFRGVLLRALQRRATTPVAVFGSAFLFAVAHVAGGADAYALVPGLFLLGLASGVVAVRSGNLTRSVLLHMGFNLLSAVVLVAS